MGASVVYADDSYDADDDSYCSYCSIFTGDDFCGCISREEEGYGSDHQSKKKSDYHIVPKRSMYPISLSLIAIMVTSYIPISRSKKLPEMPGKIIAQIAIIADPIIIRRVGSDTDPGERCVMRNPLPSQTIIARRTDRDRLVIFFVIRTADAITSPIKKLKTIGL